MVAGLALWLCGILSVFGETSYFSILANPAGGLLFLLSCYDLATSGRGERPEPEAIVAFFVVAGLGLALAGFGIARAISVLPAVLLVAAGVALLALSPRILSSALSSRP